MITIFEFITGKFCGSGNNYIVLENAGIGYKLMASKTTLGKINKEDEIYKVYTYLHVREDAMELYGFYSKEERATYLMLLGVSGVGPKVALSILSSVAPSELAVSIATNNPKTISKAQGVGPKMAQRIILELKDKIKSDTISLNNDENSVCASDEALEALVALGFNADQAINALKSIDKNLSIEQRITMALKML